MKAISITEPWVNSENRNGGWRITFDEGLMTHLTDYGVIRDWLINNTTKPWIIPNSKSIEFEDHTDAMLFYIKFSAGVY